MEASITSNERTEGQGEQIVRMIGDLGKAGAGLALKKVNPDKEGSQRLIEQGDEIGSRINDFMIDLFQEYGTANQFADEVAESSYRYPNEYKCAKPIEEQIKAIAEIYNLDLNSALEYAKNLPTLPKGAEGWFAVPSLAAIARKHFPEITDPAEQYCAAIRLALDKFRASRSFYNYRENEIVPERLRMHVRTAQMLEKIAEAQNGSDILIIPCQLGMRHRGKSVRRARETFMANEFGLGSLIGASIALTHPERYVRSDELDTDLPGDEFSEDGESFDEAPCLCFDDEVEFGAFDVDYANDGFGSASGFLPQ